jgi:hypothetical protein
VSRKGRLQIEVTPFERLSPTLLPLLEEEAADLGRFFGTEADLRLLAPSASAR